MAEAAAGWQNFYIMAGGAAATLIGLIFIALTLNAKAFLKHQLYRERALARSCRSSGRCSSPRRCSCRANRPWCSAWRSSSSRLTFSPAAPTPSISHAEDSNP